MTTDVLSSRTNLTQRQEAFARLLFQGVPHSKAYLEAGYSSTQLPSTIYVRACELANSYKIKVRIHQLQAKAESDAVMTVQERKARLSEVGRANLTDFIDENGIIKLQPSAALAEYSVSKVKRSIKLRDPVAAIDSLNKMERIGATDSTIINFNEIKILVTREEPREIGDKKEL